MALVAIGQTRFFQHECQKQSGDQPAAKGKCPASVLLKYARVKSW
jgi:hypothetical protein